MAAVRSAVERVLVAPTSDVDTRTRRVARNASRLNVIGARVVSFADARAIRIRHCPSFASRLCCDAISRRHQAAERLSRKAAPTLAMLASEVRRSRAAAARRHDLRGRRRSIDATSTTSDVRRCARSVLTVVHRMCDGTRDIAAGACLV